MQVHATLTNTLPNYWAVAGPVTRLPNISATANNRSEPSDQTWAYKREVCQVTTLKHDNTIASVTPSSWYLAPGHKNLHRWQTLSILPTVPQFMHLLISTLLLIITSCLIVLLSLQLKSVLISQKSATNSMMSGSYVIMFRLRLLQTLTPSLPHQKSQMMTKQALFKPNIMSNTSQ